ncbi:MAG: hypothetical protein HZC28_07215 [Spirochaetes bacterium]|nr:hypothetical protein [Spirochaetota bacterium]
MLPDDNTIKIMHGRIVPFVFLAVFIVLEVSAMDVKSSAYHKLTIHGPLTHEPCIDVTVSGDRLYTIGSGNLRVFDITDAARPREIGSLSGLGNTRQIEIAGTTAYIVSREDGFFIVDISDPAHMRLIYHYDTLEKATGLAVSPPLAAVASRFHGVELIDISDPSHPRYLSTSIPTKEVQSVDIRNGYLYAGAWADRELVIVDIHDPYRPFVTNMTLLSGYGDGVRAAGGFAYAATGHHAPEFKKEHYLAPAPNDSGHGKGHGFEIFDLGDPVKPKRLSRIDFPPFYNGYPDMWSVDVSGDFAAVNDVYNGVFFIDIADKSKPSVIGQAVLPHLEDKKSIEPAAAVAIGDGVLYVAGYFSGLYVVDAPGAKRIPRERGMPVQAPSLKQETIFSENGWNVYRPDGQVHAAVMIDTATAAVAAGNGGIHIIDIDPIAVRHVIPTEGFVLDVAYANGMLYAAEAVGGLSLWKLGNDMKPVLAGRYRPEKGSVQQAVAAGNNRVLIENGQYLFEIIDVKDPAKPVCVVSDRGPGIFYGKCITPSLIDGRYASVYWHMGGPVWYDIAGDVPKRLTDIQTTVGNIISGMSVCGDELLVVNSGGYTLIKPDDKRALKSLPLNKLTGGEPINGMASVNRNVLITSAGAWKVIKAIDISDAAKPKVIEKQYNSGNPERAVFSGDTVMIPDGHGGLRIAKKSAWFSVQTADALAVNDIPLAQHAATGLLSKTTQRCAGRFDFDELPESLIGLRYVAIERGEQTKPGSGYTFNVNKPVTAYLFVMDAGGYIPEGWEKTTLRSKWNFQKLYAFTDVVYAKDFAAGSIIIPPHAGKSGANYGVPHLVVVREK